MELPFWRSGGPSVRQMVVEIDAFVRRYESLAPETKAWAAAEHAPKAMAEFLYQVNHIEGEGFETLEETQRAIANGALQEEEGGWKQDDDRLEHVSCLHRALRAWFPASATEREMPGLGIKKLLESHKCMLETVDPEIAGRMRGERVYMYTIDGHKHYFLEPDKIKSALVALMNRSNKELRDIFAMPRGLEWVERLVKFAGRFFWEYESIHPFEDGNGRTGRIMLAHVLRSITILAPNILFVDKSSGVEPPFVEKEVYSRCFERARLSCDPADLTALIVEGVYVGWKRFFESLE